MDRGITVSTDNNSKFVSKSLLSFKSSLEAASSFKEFFLMVDALVALDWRIEFTFMEKLYCCGAHKNCALPKMGKGADSPCLNKKIALIDDQYQEVKKYFSELVTREDFLLLKRSFPSLYKWYQQYSHEMYLGTLDNNHLLKQAPLLLSDFKFKGIAGAKIGPGLVGRTPLFLQAFNLLQQLHLKSPLKGIIVAMPSDEKGKEIIQQLTKWSGDNEIPLSIITEEEEVAESRLSGLASVKDWDFYEEHSLFMIDGNFYLNQYQHLLGKDKAFYQLDQNMDIVGLISKQLNSKILMYKNKIDESLDGIFQDYFKWVSRHVVVCNDYNFIPRFMLGPESELYPQLIASGLFNETPYGLLRPGSTVVKPLVTILNN